MRRSMEEILVRRNKIMDLLREYEELDVKKLAQALNTSEITIRRDLNILEKMGTIRRFHGGAQYIGIAQEDAVSEGETQIEKIKNAIAKVASSYVSERDTIFINSSSTALLSIPYIEAKRTTIITNNAKVTMVEHPFDATIMLSGGEVRFPKEALVGEAAIDFFSQMTSNLTIIGCSGFSIEEGVSTSIVHEAKVNTAIMNRSRGLKIVVADYRKIGYVSNFISAPIAKVDVLITDCFVNPKLVKEIEEQGIDVIQVSV